MGVSASASNSCWALLLVLCALALSRPSSAAVSAAFASCPVLPARQEARPRQAALASRRPAEGWGGKGGQAREGRRRCLPSLRAVISQVDDYLEIKDTASFFVRAFWEQSTAIQGGLQLSEAQRMALEKVQEGDMGVEIAVADRTTGKILSRNQGEEMLAGALAAMGARERNKLRKVTLMELAEAVLPDQLGLVPVLSNLAVGSHARGRGLAQDMVQQCEDAVRGWGFGEMLLLVEASNTAALSLYRKLGYQDVWTQPLQAARVADEGSSNIVTYEMVETCALGKVL